MAYSNHWRVVNTQQNDTLRAIAERELGSASRWVELVELNGIRHPYLVADRNSEEALSGRVIAFGDPIKVPSGTAVNADFAGVTPVEAYGIDINLDTGEVCGGPSGDVDTVAGIQNLKQALNLRLTNGYRELEYHRKYGNEAHRLKGHKASPLIGLMALWFCEMTVKADPRVRSVANGRFEINGDAIHIFITAIVSDGFALKLQLEI